MTHQEQYDAIINFRKSNPLPVGQYGENHHIVPKSICPILKDTLDNIVKLNVQEHFLAHYHLWLAYRDELKNKTWAKKMCYAFHRMKQQLMKCDDVEAMSKLYEEVRIEFSKLVSDNTKGKVRSVETRTKIAKTLQGHSVSSESKQKNREKHLGRKYPNRKRVSDETRKEMSLRQKGHCWSQNQRDKLSKSLVGHVGYTKGKKWFTNGVENVLMFDCPKGFWAGMTRKTELE